MRPFFRIVASALLALGCTADSFQEDDDLADKSSDDLRSGEFFGFLLTGKYTLAEVHARTQHFASWMTVLVGDPLYNPFGKKPLLKEEDVVASLASGANSYVRKPVDFSRFVEQLQRLQVYWLLVHEPAPGQP